MTKTIVDKAPVKKSPKKKSKKKKEILPVLNQATVSTELYSLETPIETLREVYIEQKILKGFTEVSSINFNLNFITIARRDVSR